MGGRIKDKGSELPSPRKVTWFCLCCCLENNVGFGMFMGILGQTVSIAKSLCFVTSQLKLLLWIWQVKGGGTKISSSVVCVPVVFVFNIGFNTDIQERRRFLSKDPEERELLPCKPGWGASRRGELADVSLCAASSVSLHWPAFLLCVWFFVGVPWSLPVSWRQGSFWIRSLQYKSLKTKQVT